METIRNYETSDIGASQSLVTLESFIGDMDNAELADDSNVDTSDAVTAINGLIFSLEQRDAQIERLRAALKKIADGECGDLGWRPWEQFAQETLDAEQEVDRITGEKDE